ncbi:hypothetical protein M918_13145 [Clostridium sp. BL8]|nr:hypothetical protein M918_13145 [Clostridium sp. BL8]
MFIAKESKGITLKESLEEKLLKYFKAKACNINIISFFL